MLSETDSQSSYAARNTGIERAEGDLLAFIDADMTTSRDWLESLVASYDEHGWDYAGCDMAMYTEHKTRIARYDMALYGFPVKEYLREHNFVHTGCLTTIQEVFDTVGLFDSRMTSQGDHEFGKRVARAGFDQHFIERTRVYHPARTRLWSWLKKQWRIGHGAQQMRRYHPEYPPMGSSRSLSPFAWRGFLPPHPRRFRERLTDALNSPTLTETAVFYALDTMSKYTRRAGMLANFCSVS